MFQKKITSGPLATNAYLLACEKTSEGVIIDVPPESFESIKKSINQEGITLKAIWLTHSHFDHIGDLAKLKAHFKTPIYVHEKDRSNVEKPGSDQIPLLLPVEPAAVDFLIEDGQILEVGTYQATALHTPGHTPGHICFYFPKEKWLFTGDTVFHGSIGNLSLPGCEPDKMWQSLEKISHLPLDTTIYPGHGPNSTLGRESWIRNAKEIFGGQA